MHLYQQMVNRDDTATMLLVVPNQNGAYTYRTFHAVKDLKKQGNVEATTVEEAANQIQAETNGKEDELHVNLYPYQNRLRGLSVAEMQLIKQGLEQLDDEESANLANEIKALIDAMEGAGQLK